MEKTGTKNIDEVNADFDRIASTQATSNCKQRGIMDESNEVLEKRNLLLIDNDIDINYEPFRSD